MTKPTEPVPSPEEAADEIHEAWYETSSDHRQCWPGKEILAALTVQREALPEGHRCYDDGEGPCDLHDKDAQHVRCEECGYCETHCEQFHD